MDDHAVFARRERFWLLVTQVRMDGWKQPIMYWTKGGNAQARVVGAMRGNGHEDHHNDNVKV